MIKEVQNTLSELDGEVYRFLHPVAKIMNAVTRIVYLEQELNKSAPKREDAQE